MSPFSSETHDREAAFGVLRDPIRRELLGHLEGVEEWIALGDLAERVAADDPRNPDRLAVALHHNHLPKLTEYGLVEYDHVENRVGVPDRESVEPYLGLLED